MKKHFGPLCYLVFTLATTLCMQTHAMWLRTAGQKLSAMATQAVAATARQARLGTAIAGRGAQTMARAQSTLPEVRPLVTRAHTITALKNAQAAQPLSTTAQALHIAKQLAAGATAVGTGLSVAYGMGKYTEARALNEFNTNHLEHYSVEFINKHYCTIIERYKDNTKAIEALTAFATQHFTNMASSILIDLLKKTVKAREQFADPIAQHIATLDPTIVSVFLAVCGWNYDILETFLKPIKQHFMRLDDTILQSFCSQFEVAFVLNAILASSMSWKKAKEEAQKKLVDIVPTELTNSEAKLLVEQASPTKLVLALEKKPETLEVLSRSALNDLKHIPTHNLALLVAAQKNENPVQKNLKAELSTRLTTLQKEGRLEFLQVMAILKNSPAHDLCNNLLNSVALTITEAHILSTPDVFTKNDTKYSSNKHLKRMVTSITKTEHDHQADYYTFVHGQRWDYLLAEKMFTDLWGTHHGKEVNDFLFAHVRNRDEECKENTDHAHLLKNGRSWFFNDHCQCQKLLFLNAPFFGNTNNFGSSTAHYFVSNCNVGSIELPLKQVFELHGDTDIYEQHKQDIDTLQKEYATLSNGHGNILFFAIPKKLAKEYIYLASPGGYKKVLSIVDKTRSTFSKIFLGENKTTNDLHEVVDALTHHPEKIKKTYSWREENPVDENEFCLIMVKEAMNPESGIKVKVFNAADPAKMQKFWKKYDSLMATVKADIEAKMADRPWPSQQHNDTVFERYQELFA